MDEKLKSENVQKKSSFLNGGWEVGVKWYEWWLPSLVGQADDYYYCYYYLSLPFFASIPLPLYFTEIPKFSKFPAIRRLEFLFFSEPHYWCGHLHHLLTTDLEKDNSQSQGKSDISSFVSLNFHSADSRILEQHKFSCVWINEILRECNFAWNTNEWEWFIY